MNKVHRIVRNTFISIYSHLFDDYLSKDNDFIIIAGKTINTYSKETFKLAVTRKCFVKKRCSFSFKKAAS